MHIICLKHAVFYWRSSLYRFIDNRRDIKGIQSRNGWFDRGLIYIETGMLFEKQQKEELDKYIIHKIFNYPFMKKVAKRLKPIVSPSKSLLSTRRSGFFRMLCRCFFVALKGAPKTWCTFFFRAWPCVIGCLLCFWLLGGYRKKLIHGIMFVSSINMLGVFGSHKRLGMLF